MAEIAAENPAEQSDVVAKVEGGFRFRTPNDVRVDQDGLIEAVITGTFDSPDSAMVDAEIEIDATRFLPCRIETMASWEMEPVGS